MFDDVKLYDGLKTGLDTDQLLESVQRPVQYMRIIESIPKGYLDYIIALFPIIIAIYTTYDSYKTRKEAKKYKLQSKFIEIERDFDFEEIKKAVDNIKSKHHGVFIKENTTSTDLIYNPDEVIGYVKGISEKINNLKDSINSLELEFGIKEPTFILEVEECLRQYERCLYDQKIPNDKTEELEITLNNLINLKKLFRNYSNLILTPKKNK